MTAVEPTLSDSAALDGRRPSIGAWAYFEGAVVPIEDARVSLATHALNVLTGFSTRPLRFATLLGLASAARFVHCHRPPVTADGRRWPSARAARTIWPRWCAS